jgi:hypothetical protein
MVVEFVDAADLFINASGGGGCRWVGGILPGEEDIVGGEERAVMPDHLRL